MAHFQGTNTYQDFPSRTLFPIICFRFSSFFQLFRFLNLLRCLILYFFFLTFPPHSTILALTLFPSLVLFYLNNSLFFLFHVLRRCYFLISLQHRFFVNINSASHTVRGVNRKPNLVIIFRVINIFQYRCKYGSRLAK